MPYEELMWHLWHLCSLGDSVTEETETELQTAHGHRYVRSREGFRMDGNQWRPKYLWVRV